MITNETVKIHWFTLLVSILASSLITAAGVAVYDRVVAPKIITVRIDKIIADHIKQIATSNLSDQQKQAMSDQWSRALDHAIKTVQGKKNVVLTQNAVIDGGTDYTQVVSYMINQNVNYTPANAALANATPVANAPVSNSQMQLSTPVAPVQAGAQ